MEQCEHGKFGSECIICAVNKIRELQAENAKLKGAMAEYIAVWDDDVTPDDEWGVALDAAREHLRVMGKETDDEH